MKKEDELFGNGEKLDEALLEFEFDLSEEDLGGVDENSSSEEDVIELVDVVEEGDDLEDLEPDDIVLELEADEFMDEQTRDEDRGLAEEPELELDLDDSELERLEAEFDDMTQGPSEEAAELDIQSIEETEELEKAPEFDLEALSKAEAMEEESYGEDLGDEDLEQDTVPDLEGLAEAKIYEGESIEETEDEIIEEAPISELQTQTEVETFADKGYPPTISEERVEQIFREVVAEVLEKVARETMVSVAEKVARETMVSVCEKVIGEAIDTLKQCLESPSE